MSTVGYLRCSTDSQDTLRQREDIERSGITVDHWLEDHESRDKAHKRPDFQRLLRSVQAGQVDTIVVQALDRFGTRDPWQLGSFFTILKDHNCRLLDATGKRLNADDDGYDVVALDNQGNEVWRCVMEGHDKRVKVYPDGRRERFDGPKNRPPKALHETLKYRPSIVAERIEYVVLIFKWYTTEAISAGQIAARLNDLGVSPVYSPLWHQGVVKYILSNPICVGRPAYNKASQGRFMEFVDGQVKTANRSKATRKRSGSDQICPDAPEFQPIVEQEVFDKAQAKLAAAKKRTIRAPNTVHMWLKGFVVCGECGKPMRIHGQAYRCSNYCRWGKRSDCGNFEVEHDLLENLVLDYLTETAPKLKALMDASTADDLEAAKPLLTAIFDTNMELRGVWHEMAFFTAKHPPGETHEQMSIEALYEAVYTKAKPTIEKAIAEKEAELEALLDGFAGLSPKLKERANKRGEALQKEIDDLQRDQQDLRIPWERLRARQVPSGWRPRQPRSRQSRRPRSR